MTKTSLEKGDSRQEENTNRSTMRTQDLEVIISIKQQVWLRVLINPVNLEGQRGRRLLKKRQHQYQDLETTMMNLGLAKERDIPSKERKETSTMRTLDLVHTTEQMN